MSGLNWDRATMLPPGYWLRSAYPEDLSQLVELLLTSFYPENRLNRWFYSLMRLGIQEDIKRRLRSSIHQYVCLVIVNKAASGPVIVGTVEISLRSHFWQPLQPRCPYIANVAVEPHHRRSGLAQQMLLACESISQTWGFRQLYLHVSTDNPAAVALYRKVGYQVCGHSPPWRRRQMMVKQLCF
ncbi:GNAT family N-acetyltransferase [Leptolyngbya cf. ectocarpi LEGE 11479]|uniref:GNAT family N-acetyltransferase n=1 Tax=Leptolyngbya cf. ectocarpi LEGE 11479 TaxID=1828722 RepID=A0A928ZZX5_LEPEC|nr:GNAT family N-acetyltransferase [Leptolyngbya ectocarpi]MBE9070443.1 GNAT family N-acetyltransferase [Leptolyngbya cf. ectocarpi LEGE 11479]